MVVAIGHRISFSIYKHNVFFYQWYYWKMSFIHMPWLLCMQRIQVAVSSGSNIQTTLTTNLHVYQRNLIFFPRILSGWLVVAIGHKFPLLFANIRSTNIYHQQWYHMGLIHSAIVALHAPYTSSCCRKLTLFSINFVR